MITLIAFYTSNFNVRVSNLAAFSFNLASSNSIPMMVHTNGPPFSTHPLLHQLASTRSLQAQRQYRSAESTVQSKASTALLSFVADFVKTKYAGRAILCSTDWPRTLLGKDTMRFSFVFRCNTC